MNWPSEGVNHGWPRPAAEQSGVAAVHGGDGLKQLAQDHYNRNLRLKAWEDYMLANDPPSVSGG